MTRVGSKDELSVGSLVAGRYALLRLLGEGGMGAVYEAEHRITRRRSAVKLMHQADAWSAEAVERFVREARVVARIGHPNIVEVLDAGVHENGQPFMALELLAGETFCDRLERPEGIAPREAIEVCAEVLEGLVAAHGLGIVHRDIKPENVFLVADDSGKLRVKILDFGVSKITNDGVSGITKRSLTQSGAAIGTLHYMSPEQVVGKDDVDARSDLWAVGVMLYRALTGQFPFDGNNVNVVVLAIMTTELRPVRELAPSVPEPVAALVERALRKNREERFSSAREMLDGLRALALIAAGQGDGPASGALAPLAAITPQPSVDAHAQTIAAQLAPEPQPPVGMLASTPAPEARVEEPAPANVPAPAPAPVLASKTRGVWIALGLLAAALVVGGGAAAMRALGRDPGPTSAGAAVSSVAPAQSATAVAAVVREVAPSAVHSDAGVVVASAAPSASASRPVLAGASARASALGLRREPRDPPGRAHAIDARPSAPAPSATAPARVVHEVPVADFGGT